MCMALRQKAVHRLLYHGQFNEEISISIRLDGGTEGENKSTLKICIKSFNAPCDILNASVEWNYWLKTEGFLFIKNFF